LLDHSIYFFTVRDTGWKNLFEILRPEFSIIDVGANIGFLSLNFAHACPKGRIYSFEPDSETFISLRHNVQLTQASNITLFNKAVGAAPGTAHLYKIYSNNPGANRILKEKPEIEAASETIEIVTLDSLKAQGLIDKVELIKIDVEGFESFVLEGARSLINEWKPILFVELAEINLRQQNCTALSLIQLIEDLGYNVLDARVMKPVDRTVTDHHTDVVCFPK
jgi:FkbM family methyltransferase